MLYTARKYISDRCYNGTIMSTLFVTQYCHVHFHGGGVVVLESTYSRPRNPLYTTKEFFKADLSTNTTHLHDGVTLLLRSQSFSYFPFMFFFLNLVIPARLKALICTRKRNPEDSGRSSKMASSCQWPFSSFLLASSLLNSTLTTLALYNPD